MSQILGQDTFVRANQSGWGTASDSQTWSYIDGTQASSIVSNAGQITSGSGSALFTLGSKQAQDMEVKVRAYITGTGGDRMGVLARVQNTTTFYRVYWKGGGTLVIERSVADTKTTLTSTSFSVTSLQYYWIRAQVYSTSAGTIINAKIWQDGSSEPSSWTLTYTDTNPLTGAGQHGIYLYTGSNSNVAAANSYTALSLTNPRDIAMRARFANSGAHDIALRLCIGGHAQSRDWAMRARLMGFGSKDIALRASLDEAHILLPTYVAGSLSATIGDYTNLSVKQGSLTYSETANGRSIAQFIVEDPTGQLHFQWRQPVIITHSVRGELFRGYVNTSEENNLVPNPNNEITITCIDEHWKADKRSYEVDEFENTDAGVIAAFLAAELADEGVTASYAIDYDTTQDDFSQGTLSNTVAAANIGTTTIGNGDLELAPAGQTLSIVEQTLAQWQKGTFSNMQANGLDAQGDGYLSLAVGYALKYTGTASLAGGGNLYTYNAIWSGAQSVASGDTLIYDVWVASTSPEIKAGVDLTCTDGTTLRGQSSSTDQQGIGSHPGNDLSGLANDQWYTRYISVPLSGKTIQYVTLAFEGDTTGDYTAYFRNIRLVDSNFNLKQQFFSSSLNVNPAWQQQNSGYSNVKVAVVTAFQQSGYRISPAYDLSSVGIVRSSLISWDASIPTDSTGQQISGEVLTIEASLDNGASWQMCTSGQPIPGLPAGMAVKGKSLMLRETITDGTPDPTQASLLFDVQATIAPASNGSKVDIAKTYSSSTDWNSGALSNLIYSATNGGLSPNGIQSQLG